MSSPEQRAVISGIGQSAIGRRLGRGELDLTIEAALAAIADAGLTRADIDGLAAYPGGVMGDTGGFAGPGTPTVQDALRLSLNWHSGGPEGPAQIQAVINAVIAVSAGLARHVLVYRTVTESTAQGAGGRAGIGVGTSGVGGPFQWSLPFRAYSAANWLAMNARRHFHEFGTTREQLAAVAVAAREWALLNPAAWEKKPLSIADVLSSRMVSYPFTVRDCCLVTDGGGAIIVTSAERAKSLKKPPAYVLGCGHSVTHANITSMPDLTVTGALASGKAAYAMAGLGPADIDAVELYDAFTINTILFLEDLGFCKKGEGGAFVSGGRIAPGGSLAVNTNGGGLSYCHPGMYGLLLLIEAVRQLRGECGGRQVKDCEVAMAHGNGGVLSSQATVILGAPSTL